MKEYIRRRKKLFEMMDDQSMLFVFAGDLIKKSADATYPFEVNRNFYYLTGVDEPQAVLVLNKLNHEHQTWLFVRDIDPHLEKWNGKYMTQAQAQAISGIDTVYYLSQFKGLLQQRLTRNTIKHVYVDSERLSESDIQSTGEAFAQSLRKQWLLPVNNAYPLIAGLRAIKDELEIQKLKAAIDITNEAFLAMLRNTQSGKYEYELQAEFEYVLKKYNSKPAFDMIVAAGGRACILHYIENDQVIEADSLILTDMGATQAYYCADISRTFPSDGQFSDEQRTLMGVVLEAMDKVIEACQVGVTMAHLNRLVIEHYQERLVALGFIQAASEVSDVYYHGVSHMLGLDTHDVGYLDNAPLVAGNVITVEPGLYFESLNLGIRIEDNILITDAGPVNLSEHIIKTPAAIENYMQQNKPI